MSESSGIASHTGDTESLTNTDNLVTITLVKVGFVVGVRRGDISVK